MQLSKLSQITGALKNDIATIEPDDTHVPTTAIHSVPTTTIRTDTASPFTAEELDLITTLVDAFTETSLQTRPADVTTTRPPPPAAKKKRRRKKKKNKGSSGDVRILVENAPNGFVLSESDQKILTLLFELEDLRGSQDEMEQHIEEKLKQLDMLLVEKEKEERSRANSTDLLSLLEQGATGAPGAVVSSSSTPQPEVIIAVERPEDGEDDDDEEEEDEDDNRVPKAFGNQTAVKAGGNKGGNKIGTGFVAKINLFENLQKQLLSILKGREEFIRQISDTINDNLDVIQKTISFMEQIVKFKIDQSEVIFGKMNPIVDLFQSGSTSIFLLISQFFQAVESLLAMKVRRIVCQSGVLCAVSFRSKYTVHFLDHAGTE